MDRGDSGEDRSVRRESGESRRRYRSRSRSRDRDRGHYSRGRKRSRSRDRDRYSARSRSRERAEGSWREQSRSRERDRGTSSRYRDRSRSQERRRERDDKFSSRSKYDDHRLDQDESSRSWDHRSRRSRDGDRWSRDSPEDKDEPSPVLMLRNLKEAVRKEDISRAIGMDMSYVKDIRLVQRSHGNQGFAFLEFYKPQDASRWLEQNKVNFKVLGGMVDVEFSHHKQIIEKKSVSEDRDWSCFKCGTLNFARRRMCMTCDCSRGESESLHADVREGRLSSNSEERRFDSEPEGRNPPSNVLIFRGMDALSDETSVRSAIAKISSLLLKDVRLIRDKATSTSRGFCFVELNSIDEAKQLLEVIQNQYPAFFVDGRRLIVNYARQMNQLSGKSVSSSVASAAIEQAQWSMQTLALMKSSAAQSQGSAHQSQVTQNSVHQAIQQGGSVTSQAQTTGQSGLTTSSASTTSAEGQTEQLPSTYSYDPTSGFYYDSASGLYYDPKTQYHYNSQTGLYCYYDPQQQAYVSVDQQGNPVPATPSTSTVSATDTSATTTTTTTSTKSKKNVVTSSNVTNAKKIAKDMERWAKSVNAAKAVQQQQVQATVKAEVQVAMPTPDLLSSSSLQSLSQSISDASAARSGIALTAALRESDDEKPSLAAHAVDVVDPVPAHCPTPTGVDMNPAHTDWSQLACLLCKRKFPSKEVLIKHQQFSELHKQNLAKEKAQSDLASEVKYRDRAKERRDKYGSPAIVPGWKKRLEREIASEPGSKDDHEPPVPYEQPTVEGLKGDNIGSKMLQAMGWSEGQGLGKSHQGIVEPIKAEQRLVGAGLGAPGSKLLYSSGGTYRDTLRQLTRARYDGAFQ